MCAIAACEPTVFSGGFKTAGRSSLKSLTEGASQLGQGECWSRVLQSYLPEKENQQGQQQQPKKDGHHDDPPWQSSKLGLMPLWEYSQPHLGETTR